MCDQFRDKIDMFIVTILGMMAMKRRKGTTGCCTLITKNWTRASLEENVRVVDVDDRTSWRERSRAAGAANVSTDDKVKYMTTTLQYNDK